mgnify:CR=1 FL=1
MLIASLDIKVQEKLPMASFGYSRLSYSKAYDRIQD